MQQNCQNKLWQNICKYNRKQLSCKSTLSKVFNKINLKISYSCTKNITKIKTKAQEKIITYTSGKKAPYASDERNPHAQYKEMPEKTHSIQS